MKITKEQFDRLYDDTITKKEYDNIITLISGRVDEVWRSILKLQGRALEWYDFDNEHGETSPGKFDPDRYKTEIGLTGVFSSKDNIPYENYFHTRFLWEDFEDEVVRETNAAIQLNFKEKEKKKKSREELRKKREIIRNVIASKLTTEELKYITFR